MTRAEGGLHPLLAVAAAIVLLHQALDLFSHAAELDLATPSGRIGLITAVWSRGPALLAADACLVAAAILGARVSLTRVLGLLHIVAGLAALVAATLYLVDAGRIAENVGGLELTSFRITVARMLIALNTLGLLGLVAGLALRDGAKRSGEPIITHS